MLFDLPQLFELLRNEGESADSDMAKNCFSYRLCKAAFQNMLELSNGSRITVFKRILTLFNAKDLVLKG